VKASAVVMLRGLEVVRPEEPKMRQCSSTAAALAASKRESSAGSEGSLSSAEISSDARTSSSVVSPPSVSSPSSIATNSSTSRNASHECEPLLERAQSS